MNLHDLDTDIDLKQLARVFVKLRAGILVGTILGAALSAWYFAISPKVHVIKFPVSVRERNISFTNDPDVLVSTFNSRVSTIGSINASIDLLSLRLQNFSPAINAHFNSKSHMIYDYVQSKSLMFALSSFRGDEDFQLELRLPFALKEKNLLPNVLKTINDVLAKSNLAQLHYLESVTASRIQRLAERTKQTQEDFRKQLVDDGKSRIANIKEILALEKSILKKSGRRLKETRMANIPGYGGILINYLNILSSSDAKLSEEDSSAFEKIWTQTWVDIVNERMIYSAEKQIESIFNDERANFLKALSLDATTLPTFVIEDEALDILNNQITSTRLDRIIFVKSLLFLIASAIFTSTVQFLYLKFKGVL